MPDVTYELKVEAGEETPVRLQVISYDNEGENLPNTPVSIEVVGAGTIGPDRSPGDAGTTLQLVTNTVAKAYFVWQRPAGSTGEASTTIKASWDGRNDPFIFIERFHPREHMELI